MKGVRKPTPAGGYSDSNRPGVNLEVAGAAYRLDVGKGVGIAAAQRLELRVPDSAASLRAVEDAVVGDGLIKREFCAASPPGGSSG